MMTRAEGISCTICRVASKPLSRGMAMSMTTTCGMNFLASWTAWRPVSASATTSMSGSAIRRERRPWRTKVWSSARRTVILFMVGTGSEGCGLLDAGGLRKRFEGNSGGKDRPATGKGGHGELAADKADAFGKSKQAKLLGCVFGTIGERETAAVVGNLEFNAVRLAG